MRSLYMSNLTVDAGTLTYRTTLGTDIRYARIKIGVTK